MKYTGPTTTITVRGGYASDLMLRAGGIKKVTCNDYQVTFRGVYGDKVDASNIIRVRRVPKSKSVILD